MYTTFHLDTTSELNTDFLKAIKTLFKNQRISVTVEAEMDETEYLMSSEANRLFLEKSDSVVLFASFRGIRIKASK